MPSRYRLSNGLTVVFEAQAAAPVVAFQVWVRAGSADETAQEVGLAHLHEHMLFKGTARRGLGEIARSIEAHGGEVNAWTSFDQTAYHVVMASRFAREGLDVLADALRNSAFDAGELEREIEVVCEEIKRSLDMPSRRASKHLFEAAYRTHPYGRPVIGFEPQVRAHSREGVLGFYRQHYVPSNMVLSAVGDFTEAQLKAWVEECFGGDWGRPPVPRTNTRPAEPTWTGTRVELREDEVKEAHLHLAFQCPAAHHPDAPALDLLAMVLGQGDASRLSMEVRRKRSLARDASAWAWTPQEPGLFSASVVAEPATLDAALAQALEVMATLAAVEVTAEELDTLKALVEAEAVYQRETVQGLSRKLAYWETALGGLEAEARYYEALAQVTPRQVLEVAQRYLTFDRAVVVGLLPRGAGLTEARVRELLAGAATRKPQVAPARDLPPARPIKLSGARNGAVHGTSVHRLPSGARIVIREEHGAPLFALRATFPGGLRYETAADNGVTALLARTWSRGTTTLSAEQVSHLTDRLAGGIGAVPGRSTMSLRGEFLSRHFQAGFDLFTEVLGTPAFSEAEVARERGQLLQDIAARDDRPSSVAFELFAKTLYTRHPYRLSTLGEKASLAALGPEQLRAFHARHLDWSGLVLAVVGDVDAQAVLERATAAFGQTRGTGVPSPVIELEPPPEHAKEVRRHLQKAQSHLVYGFRGATVTDDWKRPLEVLSTLLNGQSGRLFLELRDKRSMAYSVSSSVVQGADPGWFSVYIGTSPEKVEAALAGIKAELLRLQQEPVGAAELERAVQHLLGTHDIGLQRNGARAGVMALDEAYGLGATRDEHYAEDLQTVTVAQLQDVAQRVFDFEHSALAVVGPQGA